MEFGIFRFGVSFWPPLRRLRQMLFRGRRVALGGRRADAERVADLQVAVAFHDIAVGQAQKAQFVGSVRGVGNQFPQEEKNPLTKEEKKNNRQLASARVLNENVIGALKRFKIISDRYRNRRKRFALRFNLIAGIYNLQLIS